MVLSYRGKFWVAGTAAAVIFWAGVASGVWWMSRVPEGSDDDNSPSVLTRFSNQASAAFEIQRASPPVGDPDSR